MATGTACAAETKRAKDTKQGAEKLSKADRNFMKDAANGGLTEVEVGKMAQAKGGSDAVKQSGKKLEDNHAKANDELKGIAQKMNVELPAKFDKQHEADLGKLSKLSGQKFDQAFAKLAVADSEEAFRSFAGKRKRGTRRTSSSSRARRCPPWRSI